MYGKLVKDGSYMSHTYQITTELGSGGGGAVYKAWHKRLRKHVVIKASNNSIVGTLEARRNEVEALKNVKNMHIPQVLDYLSEEHHSFTIMEYINGDSFDKLLKLGNRFPETQVIKWYFQLASALNSIHKHDVYHRDIKPANIIRMTNGDVCLIDFNSALVIGNNTGMVNRSMGYASPEQYEYFKLCRSIHSIKNVTYSVCSNTPQSLNDNTTVLVSGTSPQYRVSITNIDWKLSDIYSLGATMYHFLTGKRPPKTADDVANIPNLKGYSGELLKIIEKSMRTNPGDRFSTANELTQAIISVV